MRTGSADASEGKKLTDLQKDSPAEIGERGAKERGPTLWTLPSRFHYFRVLGSAKHCREAD